MTGLRLLASRSLGEDVQRFAEVGSGETVQVQVPKSTQARLRHLQVLPKYLGKWSLFESDTFFAGRPTVMPLETFLAPGLQLVLCLTVKQKQVFGRCLQASSKIAAILSRDLWFRLATFRNSYTSQVALLDCK